MKMNLIKARAALARMPKVITIGAMQTNIKIVKEKYGVTVSVIDEGEPDYLFIEVKGYEDKFIKQHVARCKKEEVEALMKGVAYPEQIGSKQCYVTYYANGDKAYYSYQTLIGFYHADTCTLYEDMNYYSNTTCRHKSLMLKNISYRNHYYFEV